MKNYWRVIFVLFSFVSVIDLSGQTSYEISVKDFGAKGDGISLDTKAIQSAIDKCSESGGTVVFTPGRYLTGSLELKNNVDIYIANGAVILGSTNIADYFELQPMLKSYNDIFLKHSLFYAERIKNISIRGEGIIDGQGSYFKVTTKVKPDRYFNRPYIIRFIECEDVKIENITLRNSAMWMQQYLACTGLVIRGIKVFNHANQNNDMMDIDGCKNVIISDCLGDTDDDAIVLKSTSKNINENIVINNCIVSSHCNAIKMGTESTGGFRNITISNIVVKPSLDENPIFGTPGGTSGITLATVDGGILEDVTISNIVISGPQVPICLRLGNRARKHTNSAPDPGIGAFRNVIISNVFADNVSSIGCSITGIPGRSIENVSLNNIKIVFNGGVKKGDFKSEPAEMEDSYPEGTMWGNLPAYGFFVRHARDIIFNNVSISFKEADERPAIVLDDADDIKITVLVSMVSKAADYVISAANSQNVHLENSVTKGETKYFISVNDVESKNIFLSGNDLTPFQFPVKQKSGDQVKLISNIHKR